jgi:hypothetical protein
MANRAKDVDYRIVYGFVGISKGNVEKGVRGEKTGFNVGASVVVGWS